MINTRENDWNTHSCASLILLKGMYRRMPDITTPPPLRPLRDTLKKKRHVFETSVSPKACQCNPKWSVFIRKKWYYNMSLKKVRGGVTGFGDTLVSKHAGSHVRGGAEGGGRYIWYSTVKVRN